MIYFNENNIAFSTILNGSLLDPEMVQFGEAMKKWLTLDPEGTETYDMVFPEWVRAGSIEDLWIANSREKLISYNGNIAITQQSLFSNIPVLETVYLPKCTELGRWTFRNDHALKTITLGVVTDFGTSAFAGCTSIENFTIGVGTTASNLFLSYSDVLTVESMQGIIDNYADLSASGGATITFGTTNLAKLSEEYKQKAVAKGLTLA